MEDCRAGSLASGWVCGCWEGLGQVARLLYACCGDHPLATLPSLTAPRLTRSSIAIFPLPFRPQYAQRVSTIRNDVSKHESSVELLKLKKQVGGGSWRAAVMVAALVCHC